MTDIILDDNDDLMIQNGDFVLGESTSQEVEAIIRSFPGWWKEFPLVGCKAINYLNGPNPEKLRRDIQVQLQADGKQLTSFSYNLNPNGTLTLSINGSAIDITP